MPGRGGGGGRTVTVCEVPTGVVGAVFAGLLVGFMLAGVVPLEEVVVGGVVNVGDVVLAPLSVGVVKGLGGDVARGSGQVGNRESVNNFRSCDSA